MIVPSRSILAEAALPGRRPTRVRAADLFAMERALFARGARRVAGVDEVGVGPLAGPVVAAAVVLRPDAPVAEARDSKTLPRARRERLAERIRAEALAWAVGVAGVEEIDARGIRAATLLAMRRAALQIEPPPDHLLVDALTVPGLAIPQDGPVHGDALSLSIASASIVAKVHRDAIMNSLAERHPGYGFERHSGYATAAHVEALRRLGPCPEHRASWTALGELAGTWSAPYYRLRDALDAAVGEAALERWALEAGRALAGLPEVEARRLAERSRRAGISLRRGRRPRARPPMLFD